MTAKATYHTFEVSILDDSNYCDIISQEIRSHFEQDSANDLEEVELKLFKYSNLDDFLQQNHPDLSFVVVDYSFIIHNERQIIKEIKNQFPMAKIVIISQEISFRTAVTPIIRGADIYFQKGPKLSSEINSYLTELISSLKSYKN